MLTPAQSHPPSASFGVVGDRLQIALEQPVLTRLDQFLQWILEEAYNGREHCVWEGIQAVKQM